MANEILKPITNLPHYYITKTGQVFSTKISPRYNKKGQLREVKPKLTKGGYHYLGAWVGSGADKHREWHRVHRIVYREFVGPTPQGLIVDHKNAIKTDNRVENLQLLTKKANSIKYHTIDKQIRDGKAIKQK